MSGRSSGIIAPNSGKSAEIDMRPRRRRVAASRGPSDFGPLEKRTGSEGIAASRNDNSWSGCRRSGSAAVDALDVVDVVRRGRRCLERQFKEVHRRREREIVTTITAPVHALEPQIAALGTLHGTRRSPGRSAGRAVLGALPSRPSITGPDCGNRRQRDELELNFAAQPVGVRLLRIGRPHQIERGQRVRR